MGRLRRILYLERRRRGSVRALACAARVVRARGASLTLAGPPGRRLERLQEVTGRLGAPVSVKHLGRGESLVRAAAGYDLVVMVGRDRDRQWSWGRDSPERELARECSCPVWIVHPAQGPELRVIIAALSAPGSGPDKSESRGALRVAAELSASVGASLNAVHCWSVLGETLLASRSRGGSPGGAKRVAAATKRRRREQLERLLEEEGLASRTELLLCKDTVVSGLREAAWRLEADVVVMGTAGRTGLGGVWPGNPAERVIGRVPASVVIVPGTAASLPVSDVASGWADAAGVGPGGAEGAA